MPFKSRRLLLVRLDAIGDYVLFRNYIQLLKVDEAWRHYRISLIGNKVFENLAENLDNDVIDEFIWINPMMLRKRHFAAELSFRLKLKCFDVLVNPMHSRNPIIDVFLSHVGSKTTIGSQGDDILFKNPRMKPAYDQLYNRLVPVSSAAEFEFFRNKSFFESLLNKENDIELSITSKTFSLLDPSVYNIVIFPGASYAYRQWSFEKFARLIDLIKNVECYKGIHFYIAGAKADSSTSKKILEICGYSNITDLTGRTTLCDLCDLLGTADLLISNETSAVHIAAATNTATVCISNGNHYGRFNPYPTKMSDKIVTIYPFDSFYTTDESERIKLAERYKFRSDLDINTITEATVFEAVSKLIKQEK